MGGLAIRSFIVQALIDGKGADLDHISDVILFGTPNDGLSKANFIPRLVNQQIVDMGVASKFIIDLRRYWVQRVIDTKVDNAYNRRLRTLAVAGLSDQFVPKQSVTSFFSDTATTDGDHISMVKPKDKSHLTYRIIHKRLNKIKKDQPSIPDESEHQQDSLKPINYCLIETDTVSQKFTSNKSVNFRCKELAQRLHRKLANGSNLSIGIQGHISGIEKNIKLPIYKISETKIVFSLEVSVSIIDTSKERKEYVTYLSATNTWFKDLEREEASDKISNLFSIISSKESKKIVGD